MTLEASRRYVLVVLSKIEFRRTFRAWKKIAWSDWNVAVDRNRVIKGIIKPAQDA